MRDGQIIPIITKCVFIKLKKMLQTTFLRVYEERTTLLENGVDSLRYDA